MHKEQWGYSQIDNAEMLVLKGNNHQCWTQYRNEVSQEKKKFLTAFQVIVEEDEVKNVKQFLVLCNKVFWYTFLIHLF